MSDIKLNLQFPLDDDGFFRRECPFCLKESKILLEKEELIDLAQKGIDSFMVEPEEEIEKINESDTSTEFTCPYCGQRATSNKWWTQEQLAYISVIVKNITAQLINENLIKPLKRTFGQPSSGMISIKFEGNEVEQEEPWISPEVNDMVIFDLPCCNRKMKYDDDWNKGLNCFFCGFPYTSKNEMKSA
jgi:hypothetical protein